MKFFGLHVLIVLLLATALTMSASDQEYAANWPRFRGPDGSGVSVTAEVPLSCDLATGANVAWTVQVPAPGFSSPIVWGNRVFLSGGDEARREVMCFDVGTGKLLWETAVPKPEGGPEEAGEVPEQCGMAASTLATDGTRVYAMFANGELAAFAFNGTAVWSKSLGFPKNAYGHSTSLLTWRDRLLVQMDQGEPDDALSKIYAFDGATGALVWEKPRPAGASWATPIVIEVAGQVQIVTLCAPWVIAYAAEDGVEVWRADCLDGEVTPSPILAGGTLFVINPSNKLQAIRPDGRGDVTKTHLLWGAEDNIPDVTSPVSDGELVFVIDTSGTLTCDDAKTGQRQWTHELGEECAASPSIAGHHLYLLTKKGTLLVLDATREFHELARSALGEPVYASPAFTRDRIFVRTVEHLLCLHAGSVRSAQP